MYFLETKKIKSKKNEKYDFSILEGFLMASKNKVFKIDNTSVRDIRIVNKRLANPLVSKKVFKKYNKLIEYLTEVIIDDDDDGDTYREALNQIEKFRLQIKNKYRKFLKQKELEKMSKQLVVLQKELLKKESIIRESYLNINQNNRSK